MSDHTLGGLKDMSAVNDLLLDGLGCDASIRPKPQVYGSNQKLAFGSQDYVPDQYILL
jgi:hypothetical protein